MKKYFVFADVHSHFTELTAALSTAGFDSGDPEHILVSLGDLFDRGDETVECLKFIVSLPRERTILIRGNHETLLEELMLGARCLSNVDLSNGTYKAIVHLALEHFTDEVREHHFVTDDMIPRLYSQKRIQEYFGRLVNFAEIGDNIFVHGWLPLSEIADEAGSELGGPPTHSYKTTLDWRSSSDGEWVKASWLNGMEQWSNGNVEKGKCIWCGHWHTSWGHHYIDNECSEWGDDANFKPFCHTGIMAMDSCVHYTNFVNCEVIEES